MFAYILRKLMYMPFILLGVIFITFVLFQMSTTPESLAKIQLGEKASARQIYEYLNEKGQVSWTDAGNRKRELLSQGVLDNKKTGFYVQGKLDEFADNREDLHEAIIDLHREVAEQEADEQAEHKERAPDKPFRPSEELTELQQELGRAEKRQLENRIHAQEAIMGARRVSETLILREKLEKEIEGDELKEAVDARVSAVQHLDDMDIQLRFMQEDLEILEAAEHEGLADKVKEAKAHVDEAKQAIEEELKGSQQLKTDWETTAPVRKEIEKVEQIQADLTYTPWFVNFFYYLRDIVTLDFGDTNNRRPVMDVIKEGMWPSLALAIPGFFIAEVIGVFFGLFAAMYRQTKVDHIIVVSAILLMSINAIALIMFGQKFLAGDWNYFPITGYSEGFGAMRFLILPIMLYVVITFGERVRFNRIVMLDETNQDYVRTARSKGVSENGVLFKHILRNTLIPLITRWVVAIPSLYLGSLVLETFFSIPGLGYLTVDAISNSDANVIRAVVVFGSVSFMLAALLADVLYAVVDPRVRLE